MLERSPRGAIGVGHVNAEGRIGDAKGLRERVAATESASSRAGEVNTFPSKPVSCVNRALYRGSCVT